MSDIEFKVHFHDLACVDKRFTDGFIEELKRAVGSGSYILGKDLLDFESEFGHYLGAGDVVGVGNCTDGLYLSLKALNIGVGSEVITTPMSYVSSTSSIVLAGAKPVFSDVDLSLCLDPNHIESQINSKTRAILAVHLGGNPARVDLMRKIADKYNIFLIEDCAQALGTELLGTKVGCFGHLASFSFHPLKILGGLGDGGAVGGTNLEALNLIKRLRNHGHISRDDVDFFSHNMRLDALQAMFLRRKFKFLLESINLRQRQVKIYREILGELEKEGSIIFPLLNSAIENISFNFFILIVEDREELISFCKREGVELKVHYPRLLSNLSIKQKEKYYRTTDLTNANVFVQKIVSLPIGDHLDGEDIKLVGETVRDFYKNKR